MMDLMLHSNDLVLIEKSLNFFGNSTFVDEDKMGFNLAEKLVSMGIL